ncbi:MAG: hypothetical protein PHO00_08210 [bacterium]|nr:hypothetical protein [bacterium]
MTGDIQIQSTLDEKMTSAQDELSKLKTKQSQLEKEKNKLEKLKVKLEKLTDGKSNLQPSINKAILSLESEIESNHRMNEELSILCDKLKTDYQKISSIPEPDIESPDLENQLDKSLIVVEESGSDFKKAMHRIEAFSQIQSGDIPAVASKSKLQFNMFELVKIGFYAGLPIAVLALAVIIITRLLLK